MKFNYIGIDTSLSSTGLYIHMKDGTEHYYNYRNTSNPQQIFIRLSNTFTGCFAITDFNLSVILPSVSNFSYNSPVCINDTNPIIIPAAGFTSGGVFSSTTGLSINSSTGEINLVNS